MAINIPSTPDDSVFDVFNHWVRVHKDGRRGPKAILTPKRRKLIQNAIDTYGVDTCKTAIDGCKLSPWHQGHNPSGKRYDSIELILRDAQHIESFCEWTETDKGEWHDEDKPREVNW